MKTQNRSEDDHLAIDFNHASHVRVHDRGHHLCFREKTMSCLTTLILHLLAIVHAATRTSHPATNSAVRAPHAGTSVPMALFPKARPERHSDLPRTSPQEAPEAAAMMTRLVAEESVQQAMQKIRMPSQLQQPPDIQTQAAAAAAAAGHRSSVAIAARRPES